MGASIVERREERRQFDTAEPVGLGFCLKDPARRVERVNLAVRCCVDVIREDVLNSRPEREIVAREQVLLHRSRSPRLHTAAGGTSHDEQPTDTSYVTGQFTGTATFGPGEANATQLTSVAGSSEIVVAKYAADGRLLWAKQAGDRQRSR